MSQLYQSHIETCERCIEIRADESLSYDEQAERTHKCFVEGLRDLTEAQ